MWKYLYKDWATCRLFVLVVFPFYLLYGVIAHMADGVLFLFHILMAAGLSILPLILEDRFQSDTWLCSLPVTRWEMVAARYVNVLAVITVMMLFYIVLGSLFGWLMPRESALPLLHPGMAIVFYLLPILMVSLFLPFYFRYGLSGGFFRMNISVLGLLLIVMIVLELRSSLGGLWRYLSSPSFIGAPVRTLVEGFAGWLKSGGIGLVVVLGLLSVPVISLALSVRFYGRREF